VRAVRGRARARRGETVIATGSFDAIDPPPARSLTCCMRITQGDLTGWCVLDDGHAGKCAGVLSTPPPSDGFGPRSKR
jgi:hypothetical protein